MNNYPNDNAADIISMPVSKLNELIKSIFEKIDYNDDESYKENINHIQNLIEILKKQVNASGDYDDYHNLAVTLAKKDEYFLACEVVEAGLHEFSANVDLLSDYLLYGTKCGKGEESLKMFHRLSMIPKEKWTWRGFAFSIDYLLSKQEKKELTDKDLKADKEELLNLVQGYKKYYPTSEDAYHYESKIYKSYNEQVKQVETLKHCLESISICPKCALSLADLLFDIGNYKEARAAVERAINALSTQDSVNENYLHFLNGLCILGANTGMMDESEVLDVYQEFQLSIQDDNLKNFRAIIKRKTIMLMNKTNTPIPDSDQYADLIDLVNNS